MRSGRVSCCQTCLALRSVAEWRSYTRGERADIIPLPGDIPANPETAYKNLGWQGYGDWLGTPRYGYRKHKYKEFEEARSFARSLHLTGKSQWEQYRREKFDHLPDCPKNIPADPRAIYKASGWVSWGNWLGTNRVATQNRQFMPFEEARAFARNLALNSAHDWQKYVGRKMADKPSLPKSMPTTPSRTYAGIGWTDWGDFPGTGTISHWKKDFLPFEEARKLVRKLDLKNQVEWRVAEIWSAFE